MVYGVGYIGDGCVGYGQQVDMDVYKVFVDDVQFVFWQQVVDVCDLVIG